MKHLHPRILFFVSSIPVFVFGKKFSFLVMFICKTDMNFEKEKLNVINFNGIQKSKVSKLQSEKLLLISAFFFHFANISNGIRVVNSNEFLNSTEILKVKNL